MIGIIGGDIGLGRHPICRVAGAEPVRIDRPTSPPKHSAPGYGVRSLGSSGAAPREQPA